MSLMQILILKLWLVWILRKKVKMVYFYRKIFGVHVQIILSFKPFKIHICDNDSVDMFHFHIDKAIKGQQNIIVRIYCTVQCIFQITKKGKC